MPTKSAKSAKKKTATAPAVATRKLKPSAAPPPSSSARLESLPEIHQRSVLDRLRGAGAGPLLHRSRRHIRLCDALQGPET